ncbi:MAG: hypothetical protein IKI24_07940 [Clostridia bacterium]|nr:hypothetical protein [Clostridia bacterium]
MERLLPMMFLMIIAFVAIIRGASQKGKSGSASSSAARQRMKEDKQRIRESLMNKAYQDMRTRSAASSRPPRFEPEDEESWDSAQGFREGVDPCHDDMSSFHEGEDPCHDDMSSFHEGEDPCHDGMSPIASEDTDSPAAIDYGRARELMRGIVISEVLTRSRRRTR